MKRFLPSSIAAAVFLSAALPALAADTHRPNVGLPGPNDALAGVPVTISATVSDTESGIASCNLYVDNDDAGAMSVVGNTASVSYTFVQAGIHTIFVFCRDNENNFNSGPNASVTVTTNSGSGDGTPPSVGFVTPSTAAVDIPVSFSAAVSDTVGVTNCQLLVNGFSKGTMTISGGTASMSYTFDAVGTYTVSAQCADAAGNTGTGPIVSVSVSATPPPPPNVQTGLVKLACPTAASA